jgi:hypothetical protein
LQNPGILHVAQNHGDLAGNFSRGAGVRDGCGIGAFARGKDAETEFSLTNHALFYWQIGRNRKSLLPDQHVLARVNLVEILYIELIFRPDTSKRLSFNDFGRSSKVNQGRAITIFVGILCIPMDSDCSNHFQGTFISHLL